MVSCVFPSSEVYRPCRSVRDQPPGPVIFESYELSECCSPKIGVARHALCVGQGVSRRIHIANKAGRNSPPVVQYCTARVGIVHLVVNVSVIIAFGVVAGKCGVYTDSSEFWFKADVSLTAEIPPQGGTTAEASKAGARASRNRDSTCASQIWPVRISNNRFGENLGVVIYGCPYA